MHITERLIELRNQYGLSQTELAKKLSCPQSRVARSELPEHTKNLRVELILQLAKVYGISPRTVLLGVSMDDRPLVPIYEENHSFRRKYWEI